MSDHDPTNRADKCLAPRYVGMCDFAEDVLVEPAVAFQIDLADKLL